MEFKHFQGPNFTMEVPTDWFISSSPQFQAIFLGPETDKGVQPNLMVAVRRMQSGVTVQAVAEEAKNTQENEYPEYQILFEVDYTQKGGLGLTRKYLWYNPQREANIIQTQTFFLLGQMLYTITTTRLEDDENTQEIDETFDKMVKSFRMI